MNDNFMQFRIWLHSNRIIPGIHPIDGCIYVSAQEPVSAVLKAKTKAMKMHPEYGDEDWKIEDIEIME